MGILSFVREKDWSNGMKKSSFYMEMQNLKRERKISQGMTMPCKVGGDMEARILQLKELEERKRAAGRENQSTYEENCTISSKL